ncbi:unnamed protein product [Ceratitis capitata]|uniref:(Mediterranean fruit fly) hypothetical protein n=1 Tax=Ceratitis capitata TaxID=7213 RepID=A0A811VEQ5_CERCA|nr:unnamed protein product [Ceratitis capitata]
MISSGDFKLLVNDKIVFRSLAKRVIAEGGNNEIRKPTEVQLPEKIEGKCRYKLQLKATDIPWTDLIYEQWIDELHESERKDLSLAAYFQSTSNNLKKPEKGNVYLSLKQTTSNNNPWTLSKVSGLTTPLMQPKRTESLSSPLLDI